MKKRLPWSQKWGVDAEAMRTANLHVNVNLIASILLFAVASVFFLQGYEINGILLAYIFLLNVCLVGFAAVEIWWRQSSLSVYQLAIVLLNLVGTVLVCRTRSLEVFFGISFWVLVAGLLLCLQRCRKYSTVLLSEMQRRHWILLGCVLTVTVLVSTMAMGSSLRTWSGDAWRSTEYVRNAMPVTSQGERHAGGFPVPNYPLLADAFLSGQVHIDYPVDKRLLEIENPYDVKARRELRIPYLHDFALYNGKYYVYFGAVPALVLFMPYRLVTGEPLQTYHATQVFSAFSVMGIFVLFMLLARVFFRETPFALYLTASVALSLISVSFAITRGYQYSTAVLSGVCFMVWSIYFFLRAGWCERDARKRAVFLFFGSLCGALVFGCRPPIGMGNIALVPVLLHMKPVNGESVKRHYARLAFALSPYAVIGSALMLYNYARFDSPFNFGVIFNLTHLDSTAYHFEFARIPKFFINYLCGFRNLKANFPFFQGNTGAFCNYPILLLVFLVLGRGVYACLRKREIHLLTAALFIAPVLVIIVDILGSPWWVNERNRMDFYFLLCIVSFIGLCAYYETSSQRQRSTVRSTFSWIAAAMLAMIVLQQMAPKASIHFTMDYRTFNLKVPDVILFRHAVHAP